VRALIDGRRSRARPRFASPGDRTLRHLVVDAAGAIPARGSRPIRREAGITRRRVFDAAGRLHVLAGTQHLVREPAGQWSEGGDAGGPPARGRHAALRDGRRAGGPAALRVRRQGKALRRGRPAGLSTASAGTWAASSGPADAGPRLAVVAEDGGRYDAWSVWTSPTTRTSPTGASFASPDGRVHVVYDAQRNVAGAAVAG